MNMNDAPVQSGKLTPGEIARRALKLLAERRIVPTPDTFAEVYYEIAGVRPGAGSSGAVLKELLRDLVRNNRLSAQEAAQIQERVNKHDWPAVRDAIDRVLPRRAGAAAGNWPALVLALLKSTDALHANWTRARKLDAVGRVLEAAAAEPDPAFERLQRLVESWGPALAALPRSEEPSAAAAPPVGAAPETGLTSAQRQTCAADLQAGLQQAQAEAAAWKQVALRSLRVLEHSCGEGSASAQKLAEYAQQHSGSLTPDDVNKLALRFTDVVGQIDRQIEEQHKIKAGLQRLLALLCDNMKSLTPEEAWLAGQLEPIRSLLLGPLKAQALADAEARLALVIQQQSGARKSLHEAKYALKELLATLIERVGSMGSTTGRFYDQIGNYQHELESANDLQTIARVVKDLLADTQSMRTDLAQSRDELLRARRKVETYEQRVRQLERELSQVSTMVQKDPLTHALNRRGLEEAFRLESARATRYESPLALSLIDLDDFKRINDTAGHLAGDRALVHLLTVMQAAVRPTDVIARLGGEEFAILFSATDLDAAVHATERVQQELIKRPFEHDAQTHALTFSAGTAAWRTGEALESLVQRTDAAMYQAKRAGKNRVVRAE
ncbi:MAG: diguanylate cyclase [Burkholderiales bacterium]|jgi:diguanylate cyclase|nr:diguanylate cyclase [Burkholderiales bacterium]